MGHGTLDDPLEGRGLDRVTLDSFGELFRVRREGIHGCPQPLDVNTKRFEDVLRQFVEEQGEVMCSTVRNS